LGKNRRRRSEGKGRGQVPGIRCRRLEEKKVRSFEGEMSDVGGQRMVSSNDQ